MAGTVHNNLQEQLARFRGNSNFLSTPKAPKKKPSFSFQKITKPCTPVSVQTKLSLQSTPLSSSDDRPSTMKPSMQSNQDASHFTKKYNPPVAYVSPVPSNSPTVESAVTETSTAIHTTATAVSSETSVSVSTATEMELGIMLEDLQSQRLCLMDDICSALADTPVAQVRLLFGPRAPLIQQKLAKRKQLLSREKDVRLRMQLLASPSPSPESQVDDDCSIIHQEGQPPPPCNPISSFNQSTPNSTSGSSNFNQSAPNCSANFNQSTPNTSSSISPPISSFNRSAPSSFNQGAPNTSLPNRLSNQGAQSSFNQGTSNSSSTSNPTCSSLSHSIPQTPVPTSTPSASSTFTPPMALLRPAARLSPIARCVSDSASLFCGPYPHTQEMLKIFTKVFGLQRFRPTQLEASNAAILGRDCFILMPTGGGKSLCYQLPALMCPGVTVVVSPLRSLIQDQVQKLLSLDIPACHLSSDNSVADELRVYTGLSLREPDIKLLYVTPEKLGASNKLLSTLQNLYQRGKLTRFVIDEAHCVSQWGHDFRPDYKRLNELRQKFPSVPLMALTATATPRVQADILLQLNMTDTKWFTQSFNRTNLQFSVVPKKPKKVNRDIIDLISRSYEGKSGIVYCLSRRDCELVAGEMCSAGIMALCYHAGLSDCERVEVQRRWVLEDRCKVICATIAFGMGIDKPDVRFVIHHSLPKSVEGYYQEAGRAGRDGMPASCTLFYSYGDMARIRRMLRAEGGNPQQTRVHMENLYRMVQYCENEVDCRRVQLLEYFAEKFDARHCRDGSSPCNNCQNNVPYQEKDMTELVTVIVRSVQSVRRDQFTLVQYMEALRGSTATKVINSELSSLLLYGKGSSFTKHDLERLLHLLVLKEVLSESLQIGTHDNVVCYLKLGPKAGAVLAGKCGPVTLHIKQKCSSSSAKVSSKSTSPLDTSRDLKEECYQALVKLRMSIATERKMKNPEYVFSTDSLREMSSQLPTTTEALMNVVGVTQAKWKNFRGESFLEITRDYSSRVAASHAPALVSPYWAGQGKETSLAGGSSSASNKGKRRSGPLSEPKTNKKKRMPLTFDGSYDSSEEFDAPYQQAHAQCLQLLPPPQCQSSKQIIKQ